MCNLKASLLIVSVQSAQQCGLFGIGVFVIFYFFRGRIFTVYGLMESVSSSYEFFELVSTDQRFPTCPSKLLPPPLDL